MHLRQIAICDLSTGGEPNLIVIDDMPQGPLQMSDPMRLAHDVGVQCYTDDPRDLGPLMPERVEMIDHHLGKILSLDVVAPDHRIVHIHLVRD